MKKVFSITISVILLLAIGIWSSNIAYSADFPDAPESAWFYPYVKELTDDGIMEGYPNGRFGSWDPINRAELAKVIVTLRNDLSKDWFKDNVVELFLVFATVIGWVYIFSSIKVLIGQQNNGQARPQRSVPFQKSRQQRSLRRQTPARRSSNIVIKKSDKGPKVSIEKPKARSTNSIEKNFKSNWWS